MKKSVDFDMHGNILTAEYQSFVNVKSFFSKAFMGIEKDERVYEQKSVNTDLL